MSGYPICWVTWKDPLTKTDDRGSVVGWTRRDATHDSDSLLMAVVVSRGKFIEIPADILEFSRWADEPLK